VRRASASGYVAGLAVLGFLSFGCIAWLIVGFAAPPDPSMRCRGAAHHGCFSREPAVVKSTGTTEVTVSYEDGLRSASIDTYSDVPWPKGKRVWLERWDGTIVSVSDPATERRYRSEDNWPTRWGGFTFWAPLVCTLLFVASFVSLLRAFIRRLRPGATD
jgi:hypothetical protein